MSKQNSLLVLVSGEVVGGHEMQLKHLIDKLAGMFDELVVFCASEETFQYFSGQNYRVRLVNFMVKGKMWSQWAQAGTVVRAIREDVARADTILVSGGTIEACIASSRASKLIDRSKPVIAYMPMFIDRSVTHGLIGRIYNWLAGRLAGSIDQFVTINRIQASLLRRRTSRPAAFVQNEIRSVRVPVATHGPRLIFVGRFDDRQKGIVGLINLLDNPANPYRDLYLVGDGPDREIILHAASQASDIAVHVLGWMGNDAIDAFVGADDCLILNSAWEGEPLVIREFAARQLPCVVRNIAGVRGVTRKALRFRTQAELLAILKRVHTRGSDRLLVRTRPPQAERAQRVLQHVFRPSSGAR